MRALDAPPVTYAEYLAWPETNLPIEFVDGQVIMSPSPTKLHQRAVFRVARVLDDAAPPGLEALPSPWDWLIRREPLNVRQPDVLVVPVDTPNLPRLEAPPVLAVEVLSPTSRERDLVAKRAQYAQAGLDWYWLVDVELPQIVVLRNAGGVYAEHASAIGDEELHVDEPFSLAVRPSDLVR